MNKSIPFALFASVGLAACVSADPDNYNAINPSPSEERGTIVFYRGHSPQASLANAYLGTDKGYFLELDEDQYVSIDVPAGFTEYKVRAQGSVAFKSQIKVNAGETVCVETRPNYEELEWLVVPFINALVPSFVLEETACPSAETLGELASI